MTRDKGYGGRKRGKQMAATKEIVALTSQSDEEDNDCNSEPEKELHFEQGGWNSTAQTSPSHRGGQSEKTKEHLKLMIHLQAQIDDLKAKMEATVNPLELDNAQTAVKAVDASASKKSLEVITNEV